MIPSKTSKFSLTISGSKFRTWDKITANLFFSLFSGFYNKIAKKGFSGKFLLRDAANGIPKTPPYFLYLPSDRFFPGDIRVKDFISLCAALAGLSPDKLAEIFEIPIIRSIKNKRFSQLKIKELGEVPLAYRWCNLQLLVPLFFGILPYL